MATNPDIASLSFEEALKALEDVVRRLESGEAPLDDRWTSAAKSCAHCQARLDAAQARIEAIVTDRDGRPTGTRPFDEAIGMTTTSDQDAAEQNSADESGTMAVLARAGADRRRYRRQLRRPAGRGRRPARSLDRGHALCRDWRWQAAAAAAADRHAGMFGVDRASAVRAGTALEAVHVYSLIHDDLPCMDNDADATASPRCISPTTRPRPCLLAMDCMSSRSKCCPIRDERRSVRAHRTGAHAGHGERRERHGRWPDDGHRRRNRQLRPADGYPSPAVEDRRFAGRRCRDGGHSRARSAGRRTHLRGYARDIGLAFQIADDLLDTEGDEAVAGKALRKDAERQGRPSSRCWAWSARANRPECLSNRPCSTLRLTGRRRMCFVPWRASSSKGIIKWERIGVYPGTFDPITLGHLDIIRRGAKLVDQLIIGVTTNPSKNPMFTPDERIAMVEREMATQGIENVSVVGFNALLMKFAERQGATVIVRGLRAVARLRIRIPDGRHEPAAQRPDRDDLPDGGREPQPIASKLVKEIAMFGGDISDFVTPDVRDDVIARIETTGGWGY
jgi:pantetheine-phosphate adenylyltransferase